MSTAEESQPAKRPFTIVVEGNIGSGKSTFLNQFSDLPHVDVLVEPMEKWCNLSGRHNLLQLMYDDPKRHSLTFQSYVQLTMTQLHVKKPSSPQVQLKVMERSLHSARYCFVENLHRSGKLASSEYGVLCEWFKFLTTSPKIDLGVDLIVYLRTTPEVAWHRVKARARSEEKVIPLEYLKELHVLHEEWLMAPHSNAPAKILVVDVDQDIHSCPQLYEKIVSKVMAIIAGEPETKKARPSVPDRVMMSPIKNMGSPVKAVVASAAF